MQLQLFSVIYDSDKEKFACVENEEAKEHYGEQAYYSMLIGTMSFCTGMALQRRYQGDMEQLNEAYMKVGKNMKEGIKLRKIEEWGEKKIAEIMSVGLDEYMKRMAQEEAEEQAKFAEKGGDNREQ